MTVNVGQIQRLLELLGHSPGKIDGIWGPKSQAALDGALRSLGGQVADNLSAIDSEKAEQYLQADGCYHIPRGVDVQLSRNMWAHEIHCCGDGCCKKSIISKRMVDTFQRIRDDYGGPIQITTAGGSGYRCVIHNQEVRGAVGSLHTTGNALDLHAADKNKLLAVVNRHITDGEIGIYDWGIHAGVWNRGYVNRFTK